MIIHVGAVEKYWPKDIKLGFCMPLTWPHINKQTHVSLFTMDRPNMIYLNDEAGGGLEEKREAQVTEGLNQGCTHFFLVDGDMVVPPQILVDLFYTLEMGADLAGGLCYRGDPPYEPLIWHPTEERLLKPFIDYQLGDVVDAGATGAACLLIKKEVFEQLEKPWFRFVTTKNVERENGSTTTITIRQGEDTYFTRRATKAGCKLKIITAYDIGHMREFCIDRHFYLTFGLLNKLGDWGTVIKLFGKLSDKEWVKRELS